MKDIKSDVLLYVLMILSKIPVGPLTTFGKKVVLEQLQPSWRHSVWIKMSDYINRGNVCIWWRFCSQPINMSESCRQNALCFFLSESSWGWLGIVLQWEEKIILFNKKYYWNKESKSSVGGFLLYTYLWYTCQVKLRGPRWFTVHPDPGLIRVKEIQ